VTIDEFVEVFALFGYEPSNSEIYEAGFEKIAIYVRNGEPQHAARQLANGRWTSKLGAGIDIIHDKLGDFPSSAPYGPCTAYGGAQYFMKRRANAPYPDYAAVSAVENGA